MEQKNSEPLDKALFVKLLKAAKITEGLYTSDGELIETFEAPAVDAEIVDFLADYLIANGATFKNVNSCPPCTERKEAPK